MRTFQNTDPHQTKAMKQDTKQKKVFSRYMQEKLAITVIVITLALFLLTYILYDIVKSSSDQYNQIVLSQQDYSSRVIPYRRGDIVDRNGTYLATTDKVYNLIIDAKQIMSDAEDYLEPTVTALVNTFGYDAQEIRTLITANSQKAYIRYARQLSADEKEAFQTYESETNKANAKADSKARVKGVWFEEEYKRIYPYNSLACSVVGFAQGDGAGGNGGIEQSYNSWLIGTNGREYGYLNDDSNLEKVIKPASNGNTVVSTLDVNVQNIVEKYIAEWQNTVGSDRIGVVVMDPGNGEVLAMASDSTFDLNNPRDLQGKYTDEQLRELGEKEARDAYNREHKGENKITVEQVSSYFTPEEILSYGQQVAWNQIWRNYCVSDTYEPGSPSKIFTVSIGLEEGVLNGNESFLCDGGEMVGGWPIRCVKRTGHGYLTVAESLMQSCNDAMMQMAAMEGADRFGKYQKIFGFGSKTGIDLPGEADTSTLIYDETNMKPSDLATNSFGQNYNCTMIQMAAAFSSVINGGSYYEPHVVKQIQNEQGAVVERKNPTLVRETVSESTSAFIREALRRTVSEGTGKAAAVEGYEIAGKTGTAEKYPRGTGDYLVSFCGFAPADDPQVLVYVTIDTPHVEEQAHSSYASEVFQKIMREILPYLNVFPEVDFGVVDDSISSQLPAEEGISDNTVQEPETEPKVYETDEYVDGDDADSGIPGDLPGDPSAESSEGETDDPESQSGAQPPQTAPRQPQESFGQTEAAQQSEATAGQTEAPQQSEESSGQSRMTADAEPAPAAVRESEETRPEPRSSRRAGLFAPQ